MHVVADSADAPVVSTELLGRLDTPGPRYTSYPTADRFGESFGPLDHRRALRARAGGAPGNAAAPLSLYVHVPFCESVCYYCACNKIVTRRHERAAPYLDMLEAEIALTAGELGARQTVTQLHLGGGSPTFLDDGELQRLMTMLRRAFEVAPSAEVSIEVDPRTVDGARLRHLAALGFNRLSFGVQDFDPAVQAAVHRVQSFDSVKSLLETAREIGFVSTNVDLIYGLPMQTAASFACTVAQVSALQPDRIALYAYAHLPQRFKPQRRIDAALLPEPARKIGMLAQAIAGFTDSGYCYVGMDHFALPDDALAVARRQGRLHRNFQGYSTRPDCDLIGLGVSAISRIGATYSQNAKTLAEYDEAVSGGRFAVVRGIALTGDDLLRRDVIMALMCRGRVEFEAVALEHGIDFAQTFAAELHALESFEKDGLVEIRQDAVEVTARGWYFVRNIAMAFDRHLQADRARSHFSRAI